MVSVPDPAVLTAAFPSLPCALKREMRSNHAGGLAPVDLPGRAGGDPGSGPSGLR